MKTDGTAIPGFPLLAEIARTSRSVVYLSETQDGREVAIKILANRHAGDAEARLAFRREAALQTQLRRAGLREVYDVGEAAGRLYLVMEYLPGTSLAEALKAGPLTEKEAARIGIQLARSLEEVHRCGLVHRDVKPENVLVGDDSNARLLDFGLAIRAQGDPSEDLTPAGTFLYSSPEQAGMLHRPVDGRSDLYSLGVVLYECLAGRPPFDSPDLNQLLHQHASQKPPSLRDQNSNVTPAMEGILEKLLAKNPDERYATGGALVEDFLRLDELNERLDCGEKALLGTAQGPEDPDCIPLVGRTEELATLNRRWKAALAGQGSTVLVLGSAGLGKSRLARELLKGAAATSALVMAAECRESDPMPFAPLRQMVEELVQRTARLPPDRLAQAREVLRAAAGDSSGLLMLLVPGLSEHLPAEEETMATADAPELFHEAVADFLAGLCEAHTGALMMLDNVHWLDDSSRQVLGRLSQRVQRSSVLILASARNEEPWAAATEEVAAALQVADRNRLVLDPLNPAELEELVRVYLGGMKVEEQVASLIARRSNGSPLAALEYVGVLLEAGLLMPRWGTWWVDPADFEKLELPKDIIELILRRLGQLSPASAQALTVAAVAGRHFDPELVARAASMEPAEFYQVISEATRLHLLERDRKDTFRFPHSQIREALLSTASEERQRALHARLAEVLEEEDSSEPEAIFALARHYNHGPPEIDPERVYRANLRAAGEAAAGFADEEAYQHVIAAIGVRKREPEPEVLEMIGDLCWRTGRLEEARGRFTEALERNAGGIDRLRLYGKRARVALAFFDTATAWNDINRGLSEIGCALPARPRQMVTLLWSWMTMPMPSRRRDPELHRTLAWTYELAAHVAYFRNWAIPVLLLDLRALRSARSVGPSRELARSFAVHSTVLALLSFGGMARKYAELSVEMADELGDRSAQAHSRLYRAFAAHFSGDVLQAERLALVCLRDHGRWLDTWNFINGCSALQWIYLVRGHMDSAWTWTQRGLARLHQSSHQPESHVIVPYAAALAGMTGQEADAEKRLEDFRARLAESDIEDPYRWASYHLGRALLEGELGRFGSKLENAVSSFDKLFPRPGASPFHPKLFYVVVAHARLNQCMSQRGNKLQRLKRFRSALNRLRKAATVPELEAHLKVLTGAYFRLAGDPRKASRFLSEAEELSYRTDSPWVRGEVARQRAHQLRERGLEAAALQEARFARDLAVRHGWVSRAALLVEEFHLTARPSPVGIGPIGSEDDPRSARLQRHLDAILQVGMASACALDRATMASLALKEMVRILGAERAFLFLCREGSETLELLTATDSRGNNLSGLKGYSRTVIEQVQATGQPVLMSGTEQGPVLTSESVMAYDLRSIIAAPMLVREHFLGVIYLDNRLARGVFSREDLSILQALANHISLYLEMARATQLEVALVSERRQRVLAESLDRLSTTILPALDRGTIAQALLKSVGPVIPHTRGFVYLVENNQLVLRTASSPLSDLPERVDLPSGGFLGRLLAEPGGLVVGCTEGQSEPWIQSQTSLLGFPLLVMGEPLGLIVLQNEVPDAFSPSHIELIAPFCGHAALALERSRLFEKLSRQAVTDPLTGLYNRRYVLEHGARAVERSRRLRHPLSAVMFDIDHFKYVNDEHGHHIGDQVLQEMARRCQDALRGIDLLGRYGGEEFLVLLPGAERADATQKTAERLRQAVESTPFVTTAGPIEVRISLGVAELDSNDTLEELIDRADRALYRAKESGRNRVCAA
ncbi:MAG: diguanylate cyclase [Armatimonadetes bacterium]|nr:diguanylate cyclase [Armatimonadota bacterium]